MIQGKLTVQETGFGEILPIWQNDLWPERESAIEELSAVNHLGLIDIRLMNERSFFWKATDSSGRILGVVGAQTTGPDRFRSRGLWVYPEFRRQGIASALIRQVCLKARELGLPLVWTMPRGSALPFYLSQNFTALQEVQGYEYGPHWIVERNLDRSHFQIGSRQ